MKRISRRAFLSRSLTVAGGGLLIGSGIACAQPERTHLDPAPAARICRATQSDIEGPYFRAGAPERTTLVDRNTEGARIRLSGTVTDRACQPLQTTIDFWHADHLGAYDAVGFSFRTRVQTDADGRYSIDTIIPGRYLNGSAYRPAHIHAKIRAGGRELTTQLYFPDDPHNARDPWFGEDRLVELSGEDARFAFVV